MMQYTLTCLLAGLLSLALTAQTDIYVAPAGDNATGNGSAASPFQTIAAARDAVRDLKGNGGLSAPVTVWLANGTYPQATTLTFGPGDSGTEAIPITYRAQDGTTPVISGAVAVGDWQQRGGRWVADVSAVTNEINGLFTSADLLTRARTPNVGEYYFANGTAGADGFYARPGDAPPASYAGTRADVNVMQQWKHSRHSLVAVDGDQLTVTPPERNVLGFYDTGMPYWLENHPGMLDAPGEWYHDLEAGELLYVPRAGDDIASFVAYAPVVDRVVEFTGAPAAGQFVTHLNFVGISFRYGNYAMPDIASQPTAYLGLISANVFGTGLRHTTFTDCEVAYGAGHGVWLADGSTDNRFERVHLHGLGAGGIYLKNDAGLERRNVTYSGNSLIENNAVVNCLINDLSNIHFGAHGVWMGNVENNLVSHCDISDTNGSGINIGFSDTPDVNGAPGNIVEYTRIHDILTDINFDWSGIHFLGGTEGSIVRNNLIYNVGGYQPATYAVYHDNGNAGTLVENNILLSTAGELSFVKGRDHVYRNNVMINQTGVAIFRTRQDLIGGLDVQRNIMVTGKSRGVFSYQGAREFVERMTFDNNLYFCPDCDDENGIDGIDFDGGSFASWQALGQDQNSTYGDPGFFNVDNFNFNFQNSNAGAQGITRIRTAEIGLEGDADWTGRAPTAPIPRYERQQEAECYLVDKSFTDDFEDRPLGALPSNADTRAAYNFTRFLGNDAPLVSVTDAFAASGSRSLWLRDRQLGRARFNPNLRYYPQYTRRGTALLEFSVRLSPEASLRVQNDGRDGVFNVNLIPGEQPSVGDVTFATPLPTSDWFDVSVSVPTAAAVTTLSVTIRSALGEETQTVEIAPDFRWSRTLFLADADTDSDIYLDDIAFSFDRTATAAVPSPDGYRTQANTPLTVPAPGVLENDNGAVAATLVDGVSRGELSLSADGSFTYTPAANFSGLDGFSYTATYADGSSGVAQVELFVETGPDDPGLPPADREFRIDENSAEGTEVGIIRVGIERVDIIDDFEDGDATEWTQLGGTFTEADGRFYTGENAVAYRGSQTLTDYTVEVDAVLTTGTGGGRTMGVVGRFSGDGDYYALRLNSAGRLQLINFRNNNSAGAIAQANIPVIRNQVYRLRLELEGQQLRGYVDGELLIDVTNAQHAAGAPGVVYLRGGGYFDNFRAFQDIPVTVLASDDFGDDNSDEWVQQVPGTLVQANGEFASARGTNGAAYYAPFSGSDYTVAADVRFDFLDNNTSRALGITGRHQGVGNYYVFRMQSRTRLQLVNINEDPRQNRVLYNELFPLTSGETYRMALEFAGTTIRAYLDGELITELTDEEYGSGEAGIAVLRTAGAIDNFEVRAAAVVTDDLNGLTDAGEDRNGNGIPPFALNSATGQLTVADAGDLDREASDEPFRLTVSVGDPARDLSVEVVLNDVNDNAPVVVTPPATRIETGAASGTPLVQLEATDADVSPTTFTDWTIVSGNFNTDGDGQSAFTVDGDGRLLLQDADDLVTGEFQLGVTVSDGAFTSAVTTLSLSYRRLFAPRLLTAAATAPGALTLDWRDTNDSETATRIERAILPGGTFELFATVGPDVTTYVDATVTTADTYAYRVVALFGEERSDPSATVTVAGPALYAIAKNTARNQPNDDKIATQIRLVNQGGQAVGLAGLSIRYWFTNDSRSDKLDVQLQSVPTGLTAAFGRTGARADGADTYLELFLSEGTLAPGEQSENIRSRILAILGTFREADDYSYLDDRDILPAERITLYRDGVLIWGREPGGAGQLPAPYDLTASQRVSGSVDLAWTVSSKLATGYRVERSGPEGEDAFVTIAFLDSSNTAYTDAAAADPVNRWTYRVVATSGDIESAPSNTATVRGPDLYLKAKNLDRIDPNNSRIITQYRVVNFGEAAVDLSRLSIRYWLTAEPGADNIRSQARHTAPTLGTVSTTAVALGEPLRQGADTYLETTFERGSLAGERALDDFTVEHTAISGTFTETDDYSYLQSRDILATDRITLYYDGVLIWGVEPNLSDPNEVPTSAEGETAAAATASFDLYPNPVSAGSGVRIKLAASLPLPVTLTVRDALGRRVSNGQVLLQQRTILLPTAALSAGVYYLSVDAGQGRGPITRRLIVSQ